MRYIKNRAFWISVFALSAWVFSGTVSADCLPNVNPTIDSEIVTPYGGSALSCPDGYSTCVIDDVFDGAFCTGLMNPDGTTSRIEIAVDGDNRLTWTSVDESTGLDNVLGAGGLDAVFRTNATGGQGCGYFYGTDQVMGKADFLKNNGNFMPAKALSFCADDKQEFAAIATIPPEVKSCILVPGESRTIHGVTFNCTDVTVDETRTIIVIQNTTTDAGNTIVGVPAFGFTDGDGNINFNNVCQCVGDGIFGTLDDPIPACEPDPEDPGGEGCEVINAEVPVNISIQNPTCFTIGGFRRCF